MKKIIGYAGSVVCFWIGDGFCRLNYLRRGKKYILDSRGLCRIGLFCAGQYQKWMDWSWKVQKWAGNERPWRTAES